MAANLTRLLRRPLQPLMRPAYLLLRLWWRLRAPVTIEGAQVALWHDGELLVVRHSYIAGYGLPGGRFKPGEDPRQAACRELAEELDIVVPAAELTAREPHRHAFAHGEIISHIFEYRPAARPVPRIDGLEIVEARFVAVEEALAETRSPPLRNLLEELRQRRPQRVGPK